MFGRKISIVGAPADASEDGDFVALRAIREKKSKEKEILKDVLSTIFEAPAAAKRVSQSEISVHEKPAFHREQSSVRNDRRDELFDLVQNGSLDALKEKITQLRDSLTSDSMRKILTRENLLHFALENGKQEVVDYFLDGYNAEVTSEMLSQDYEVFLGNLQGKKNVLHKVTEMRDIELARRIVKKLVTSKRKIAELLKLETPVKIAGQRPRTFPCLHLAAFHGFTDFVQFFNDCGVDVNHLNAKKDTALLWAARWGHNDTVRVLLKRGAKPNLENDKGSTALYWAVRYRFADTVKLLIEEGSANVSQSRKLGFVAPIVLASALGFNEIVQILLKNGADVNHVIRGRERPIHHAAREGHTDVLLTLLDNGASKDETDERGDTALILSARFGHGQALVLLVKHGSDINHKNHNGEDVWYFAVNNDTHGILEILVQTLQGLGYLNSSEENNGKLIFSKEMKSPFLQAASLGFVDKVDILLKLNLDPSACDDEGNSMLHYATMENKYEVIKKFSGIVGIDAQNAMGQTPLHLACKHGYHETIQILIELKAKASIVNVHGETALHEAAHSKLIRPEAVKMLLEHVIKTHTWESLNVMDRAGKNPLHIAAKFARPDVMWEFRFVRLKDRDHDGNTPMHEAVRRNEPEALNTMLDIYETMKRDVDINEQNNDKSSVAHLAALAGFDEGVKRLILFEIDLGLQDKDGNTVLHCITRAVVNDSSNANRYLKVFDVIVNESVRWWCIKNGFRYPDENRELYMRYKRQAVNFLSSEIYNSSDLNVLALACRVGAAPVVERLMLMDQVMSFSVQNRTRYDITHITPKTNDSLTGFCTNSRVVPRPSCLEWLLSSESPENAVKILDIAPMREIEKVYNSVAFGTYLLLIILHITYMILFSYASVGLLEKRRTSPNDGSMDAALIFFYVVVPLEPALLLFYTIYYVVKNICLGEMSMRYRLEKGSSKAVVLIGEYTSIIFSMIYAVLVFTWMAMYSARYPYQDYFLAPAILIGWCMTITYTRGFQPINYFWKMIQNMLIKDISRFLIIYCFILLGFSFAFHSLFQVSSGVIDTYPNPLYTMFLSFNIMIGMGELFDDSFEASMNAAGRTTLYTKLIYIVYLIIATIVLLNLLIAMMNTSYSDILQKQKLTWRIESVQLGVDLEKALPIATRIFGGGKIRRGSILLNSKEKSDLSWFIEVNKDAEVQKEDGEAAELEAVKGLTERVKAFEVKVTEQMRQVQATLEDIRQEMSDGKLLGK